MLCSYIRTQPRN